MSAAEPRFPSRWLRRLRSATAWLALLAGLTTACASPDDSPAAPKPPPPTTASAPPATAVPPSASPSSPTTGGGFQPSPAAGRKPFGVMLPSRLVRAPGGIEVAEALGAVYFRPASVLLDQWNDTCRECDIALGAGLKLVLTVRTSGPSATAPPTDLAAYQRTLGRVLDMYRPAVLAVENEENSSLFYTGAPEDYAAELRAACGVAHHRGVPCTKGGLVSMLVALLVHDHYLESGQPAAARDFAARTFTPEEQRLLNTPQAQEQLRKGKALLSAYRSAGADYVNFHWYIADTRALGEAVTFLKAQTGLAAITNEIGQSTDDPGQTTAVMGKIVELGLPIRRVVRPGWAQGARAGRRRRHVAAHGPGLSRLRSPALPVAGTGRCVGQGVR